MFYSHLWLGALFTTVLLVISLTGILLNHKRPLRLMPDVDHAPTNDLHAALPLGELAARALAAGMEGGVPGAGTLADIDRMDVRPRNGLVKVRLRNPALTEVTLDLSDGRVLHMGPRRDVFLEQLHSGEVFGPRWVLLSDAAAVALVVLLGTGYWLWLRTKWRAARRAE